MMLIGPQKWCTRLAGCKMGYPTAPSGAVHMNTYEMMIVLQEYKNPLSII